VKVGLPTKLIAPSLLISSSACLRVLLLSDFNLLQTMGVTKRAVTLPYGDEANNNVTNPKETVKMKEGKETTSSTIWIIFGSLLLDLLAFTMILPLFPTLLEYYRSNNDGLYRFLESQVQYFQLLLGAPDRFSSVLFGGFLGSLYSFLQFLASPLVGGLSDAYGRKPVLLCCLVSSLYVRFLSCTKHMNYKYIINKSLFIKNYKIHIGVTVRKTIDN